MKTINKLSGKKLGAFTRKGKYADGLNLYLLVSKNGTRSWGFRFAAPDGRERMMGLGSLNDFSLAEARDMAKEMRKKLKDKTDPIDPIEHRRAQEAKRRLEAARKITFEDASREYIRAHAPGWKTAASGVQWESSLRRYAFPLLGKLAVADIDTSLVLRCLEPIWNTKRETATRLRGRIEAVLGWATVHGYRQGDNPAAWAGRLEHLLPSNGQKVEHYGSMPYTDVPGFLASLERREGISPIALRFLILTATRTSEALNAEWSELDLAAKTWTIPAKRMKAGVEHKVPLSDQVVALLENIPREAGSPWVFPGARIGRPLSNMSLLVIMRRQAPKYVPHGFRSSFTDWAGERTNYPEAVRDAALAHKVPDKVRAAYQRTSFFDKRRSLMQAWARFCTSPMIEGEVVTLRSVP
jgi:integrase